MIKSWSWSRLSDWRQCPRKAKFKHVDRIKEPGSAAMDRGARIHKLAETYVRSGGDLPVELSRFTRFFEAMRKRFVDTPKEIFLEESWAHDGTWAPCRWDDWNRCVLRVKLDVAYMFGGVLQVCDLKTGQHRAAEERVYSEQLELYATSALIHVPGVPVEARLVFLDHGTEYEVDRKFVPEDLSGLIGKWDAAVAPMLADREFAATPNSKCHWCWYGPGKVAEGGPGLCTG